MISFLKIYLSPEVFSQKSIIYFTVDIGSMLKAKASEGEEAFDVQ